MSDHDFDSLGSLDDTDIQIGVYALRTFEVVDGKLSSVVVGQGYWEDGACTAVCVKTKDEETPHVPPEEACNCGIYGTHSVEALWRQYGKQACRLTTVIEVAGTTVTGATGLRTAAAQVVAYWLSQELSPSEVAVCKKLLPTQRRFYNVRTMARVYGLS